jgi:regulator of protease activity HflC (stomatin/prohibitin superfamily)
VITSDNVTINVTSVVYYQILHPKNATYQVANLLAAMEQLTQTTLRNVMGGLTLDTSLRPRSCRRDQRPALRARPCRYTTDDCRASAAPHP